MNMHREMIYFEIPRLPQGMHWYLFANTGMQPPTDICEPGKEAALDNSEHFLLGPCSVCILAGK